MATQGEVYSAGTDRAPTLTVGEAMQELSFRIRAAEPADAQRLRGLTAVTLARPEAPGRMEGLRGAINRGELLLLERYDPREKEWEPAGFIEYHLKIDDTLTIRDAGTIGDELHSGIVRHLLDELLRSAAPRSARCKVRDDASGWNALLAGTPGFQPEGREYRRPHWYVIWSWSPERAHERLQRGVRGPRGR